MILDDLFTYLIAQSTALTASNLAKTVNLDTSPVPDTLTSLYEQPGLGVLHTFSTGNPVIRAIRQPRIQTLSRSTSYQTARNHAQAIYALLDGHSGPLPTSTGTNYISITAVQEPFSIGRDRNDRFLVSCNYQVQHV